jgi:hypothetical protein
MVYYGIFVKMTISSYAKNVKITGLSGAFSGWNWVSSEFQLSFKGLTANSRPDPIIVLSFLDSGLILFLFRRLVFLLQHIRFHTVDPVNQGSQVLKILSFQEASLRLQ